VRLPSEAKAAAPSASPEALAIATSPEVATPLRALLDAHYASIWRLLRRFGVREGETDDAAQEVFWIAARRLADIRAGSESAFLYGIAVRVAARARRARDLRLVSADALDTMTDEKPSAEELLHLRRARDLLDLVLDSMPDKLREVFVLFELDEIEIPAIAEILEIPLGTVGSRLRRAREEFSSIARRVRAQLAFEAGGLR
jgi:RNA polymerase sigma-70 factor (ECF subfamily)